MPTENNKISEDCKPFKLDGRVSIKEYFMVKSILNNKNLKNNMAHYADGLLPKNCTIHKYCFLARSALLTVSSTTQLVT